jgi:MYXO-CTERM domain-containing protein
VTQIQGCCAVDTDCDDGDPCTVDSCGADNKCENAADPACSTPPGQALGPFFDDGSPQKPGTDPQPEEEDPPPQRRAVPDPSSPLVAGCSVSAGSHVSKTPWVLLLLLLVLARRRRD